MLTFTESQDSRLLFLLFIGFLSSRKGQLAFYCCMRNTWIRMDLDTPWASCSLHSHTSYVTSAANQFSYFITSIQKNCLKSLSLIDFDCTQITYKERYSGIVYSPFIPGNWTVVLHQILDYFSSIFRMSVWMCTWVCIHMSI